MNTNRYSSQPVSRYKRRPAEFYGMSVPLWVGTAVIAAVILGVLYSLLTHRISV